MLAKAKADYNEASEACRQQFPDRVKQAVARATCLNEAATKYYRPTVRYADLMDQITTTRSYLAEQIQSGKLTTVDADRQMAAFVSQMTEEEQRRNLANRSVGAQELAAAAAASPVVCNRVGATTICN